MHPTRSRPPAFWLILAAGAVVTILASLSIHVFMLQVLGVPFPDRSHVVVAAKLFDTSLTSLALILFYDLARPRLARFPRWSHILIIAALFAMLREVARGIIMDGVVTTALVFSMAKGLVPIVHCLLVSTLIVAFAPRLRSVGTKLLGAVALAGLTVFAIRPLLQMALTPLLASIAYLSHDEVYVLPYGTYVLLFAYSTFLEPVVACLAIAALVWPSLSSHPATRLIQFVALIMALKGTIAPTLLYGFYNPAGAAIGMLSESQFMFEALALSLFAVATWLLASKFGTARAWALR